MQSNNIFSSCILIVGVVLLSGVFSKLALSSPSSESSELASAPNIVIFSFDDLRPLIRSYGFRGVKTPHLDRLARDSVQFNRAYTTYPVCLQSRAAMMTGLRFEKPDERGRNAQSSMLEKQDTWARVFKRHGYWTATQGKLYHGAFVPRAEKSAWDISGRTFSHLHYKDGHPDVIRNIVDMGGNAEALEKFLTEGKGDASLIYASVDGPDNLLNDGKTADKIVDHIKNERDPNKPFLISAGFVRPHMPFVAPKRYFDQYRENAGRLAYVPRGVERSLENEEFGKPEHLALGWNEGESNRTAKRLIRAYMASVSYADAQMGRIIAELKRQNLYDDTIIIMWGDHGYHLTDHGLWRKQTQYEVSTHMPLMIKAPGLGAGVSANQIVQNIDIYPTLLELANIPKPDDIVFHGKSLVPILSDQTTAWDNVAHTATKGSFGLVTPRYRYTQSAQGNRYLFDLSNDPFEWNNLADKPEHQTLIQSFDNKMSRVVWNKAEPDQ